MANEGFLVLNNVQNLCQGDNLLIINVCIKTKCPFLDIVNVRKWTIGLLSKLPLQTRAQADNAS